MTPDIMEKQKMKVWEMGKRKFTAKHKEGTFIEILREEKHLSEIVLQERDSPNAAIELKKDIFG